MAITGKGGAVYVDNNKVAEIETWSLDLDADDVDVTSFDSNGWREFLAGLKQWSGSFEGNFVDDDTNGQVAILAAWAAGSEITLTLQVASGIEFEGDVLMKPSIETPVDDKATFSCDFQGTGPLTLPGS